MSNHASTLPARLTATACLLLLVVNTTSIAFAQPFKFKAFPISSNKSADSNLISSAPKTCFAADQPKFAAGSAPHKRFVVGNDGNYIVTTYDVALNNYAVLATDAAAGDTSIAVTNAADLDSSIAQLGVLSSGDLLMIIQMQGASINTANTANYGAVTALNSAGLYEFVTVDSIAGNVITLATTNGCGALRNSYSTAGRTQVIRVPQFNNLTINAGALVSAPAWDGARGGVVALQTAATLTINGIIAVNSDGFRGGVVENDSAFPDIFDYVSLSPLSGGEKGESIAGDAARYDFLSGRYSRGAPANGGGGGNAHNAGGGGGANGNNGNAWTGQGVMSNAVTGATAWILDPGYIANGNQLTDSSGGGRAGYLYSQSNQDALTVAPGDIAWDGSNRLERGGLGGRPVNNDAASRLFLGGGGGAGDANDGDGGAGGAGGGLVFVFGNTITGTGNIDANGQDGGRSGADGPGGGGGGGTVIASANTLNGISITANGGNGGSQLITSNEAEGPGGGGGGGYIATLGGTLARTATGGQSGTTASAALTEFPVNGATMGATGVINGSIVSFPICNLTATAARVMVGGRVINGSGRGIHKALVTLTDSNGENRGALTNAFGYYNFSNVVAGQTYLLSIAGKRYYFDQPSLLLLITTDQTDVNFVASGK